MGSRSAAVQIRAPNSATSATSSPHPAVQPTANSDHSNPQQSISTADIQHSNDSNVIFQSHRQTSPTISTGRKSSPSSPRKFSLPHPARPATATPTASGGVGLTTNAPIFVPSGVAISHHSPGKFAQQSRLNKAAAEFAPSGLVPSDPPALFNPSTTSDPTPSYPSSSTTTYPSDHASFHPHNPYVYDADQLLHTQGAHSINDAYLSHDGFLPHSRPSAPSLSNFQRPLNYHLYAPPLPHSSNQTPHQLALNRFFMPASIREALQKKSEAILQGPTHEVARSPEDLGVYHSLVVLDSPHVTVNTTSSHHPTISLGGTNGSSTTNPTAMAHRSPYSSRTLRNPCWIYKAFCSLDGKAYCLYRVEGVRLKSGQGEAAIGQVERWRKIRHPAIVNVREAFTTRAFGDHSILFAYDFHPISQTLYQEHISAKKSSTRTFSSSMGVEVDHSKSLSNVNNSASRYNRQRPTNGSQARVGLSEENVIWSYTVQIANAIRTVHSANLAVRTIDPTKILLTGTNRVRINACGILDVTEYSPNQSIEDLQLEDLRDLGSLICSLASSSLCIKTDVNSLTKGVEYIKQFYSEDLNELVNYLLAPINDESGGSSHSITIDGALRMLWNRGLDELTKVFNHNDLLEECLSRELENGRLVRLMTKLGFINERPEFDHDPNWSETSERYLLKLFRDYVFHHVDSHGKPVTDLSHVLMCLNKLDASSEEKLTLISRDDQTCAIVSYAEIRRIMDSAFRDLSR